MRLIKYFFIFFFLNHFIAEAQDSLYARQVINTLCAAKFHGRGYVKRGDEKAAAFIASQFSSLGLSPLTETYYQPFHFPVNTFPSAMKIKVDGRKLIAGADYIIHPASSGVNKSYQLQYIDSAGLLDALAQPGNTCLVISTKDFNAQRESASPLLSKKQSGAVLFVEEKKLTWSVAQYHYSIPIATALRNKILPTSKRIYIYNKALFIENYKTQNVLALVKGKSTTDSMLVFTAHYDHLGMMGRHTYFPGANDNASGMAMLLNLAKYYAKVENKPNHNLLFIAFAGEEAGLVGSKYFTEHPMVELIKIKFLINLDLLGTGDDGMMVVNATEHKNEFNRLKQINEEHHYMSTIGERGQARNSDHYYFSEKKVPAFFFYTMGGIQAYHDIYDKPETLPLTKFKEVFLLIRDFAEEINR